MDKNDLYQSMICTWYVGSTLGLEVEKEYYRELPMTRRLENPGTCTYCGEVITKRSVSKHLDKCPKRQETLVTARTSSRPVETLWHLRVQDAYDKDFWLDLEMVGSASLDRLDKYLCAI